MAFVKDAEGTVAHSRDTAAVLSELFNSAEQSVLVSTFVVRQGGQVFRALSARMEAVSSLQVRLFVHVGRVPKDTRHESELLREFAVTLARQWPGTRRPEVFYDPRGLLADRKEQATWHAKCVVVDDSAAFVTSANFTEWAAERNVEAGVLVRNQQFARLARAQFDGLVQRQQVARLPGF